MCKLKGYFSVKRGHISGLLGLYADLNDKQRNKYESLLDSSDRQRHSLIADILMLFMFSPLFLCKLIFVV